MIDEKPSLIRITKNLIDVPEYKRPQIGKVFAVKGTIFGRYRKNENIRKVIEVKGHRVSIHSSEYEVVRA